MPKISLDPEHSLGFVTKSEYERDRLARLKGNDLVESSRYKIRLALGSKAVSLFAIDFLCRVNKVTGPQEENVHEVEISIFDKDNQPIPDLEITVALSLEGLLLVIRDDRKVVPNTEKGYFLSAFDEIDAELAALTQIAETPAQLVSPERATILASNTPPDFPSV
jgi:hypothetical protein